MLALRLDIWTVRSGASDTKTVRCTPDSPAAAGSSALQSADAMAQLARRSLNKRPKPEKSIRLLWSE